MREISEAWKKICCVKILTEGPTTTLEYKGWFRKRINDNIPRPSLRVARSIEENLRVVPSELEVIKQEFERKSLELGKKIEKLEEEKIYLSLDVDIQKIKVEKVRKEKRKIEEDRDDLKTQYKRIQLSMKRAGLGKSLEQWQQEVQEERAKAEYWEKKFKEMQAQNQALEKKNQGLKAEVTELGRSLHHHQSRNSVVELKVSLNKIEKMKHNIRGLEAALRNCELQIEQLEAREGHWKGELHHFQDQVRDRDYLMVEAIVQIREVADHLQDLAAQANVLSAKYESVLDRGRELALLLDRVKTLGLKAKAYL
ncbi:cilia- and flagella-associated protein 57-like [Gossypium hirsutum]|uniref:Cilia- and flagella-associated protein 57-like n=1 Tax=Gossypium hirsutum TaxID=3635 RepID=A0A1U8KH28_GOSHI|nr:cilia- and flagella-associated protein 57-like [Gossypium hirsutum]